MQKAKYLFESTQRLIIKDALKRKLSEYLKDKEYDRIQKINALKDKENNSVTNVNEAIKANGFNLKFTKNRIRQEFNKRYAEKNVYVGKIAFLNYFNGKTIPKSSNLDYLMEYLGVNDRFDLIFQSQKAELFYEHALFLNIINECINNRDQFTLEKYTGPKNDSPLDRILAQYDNNSICSDLIKNIITNAWNTIPFIAESATRGIVYLDAIYTSRNSNEGLLEEMGYLGMLGGIYQFFEYMFEYDDVSNYSMNSFRFTRYNQLNSWEPAFIQNEALKNIAIYVSTVAEVLYSNLKIKDLLYFPNGGGEYMNTNTVEKVVEQVNDCIQAKYDQIR